MSKTLVVVLGAGASKDCVAQGSISEFNDEFRPPLTRELFEFRPAFNRILQKYPKVRALSEELRTRLRDGEGLEPLLREFDVNPNLQVKKQVLEIQLYLQELLWTVGDKFIQSGGSKYDTLVRNLLTSSYEKVILLNLNYDLFVERAIETFEDHAFSDISSYWPQNKKWALVKPHGSVNWGRELLNFHPSGVRDINAVLAQLSQLPKFSDEITLVGNRTRIEPFDVNARTNTGKILFPCVALPSEGAKDFVCHDEHLDALREHVASCTSFLFIGFSGLDPHILDLLKKGPKIAKLKIVSRSLDSAEKIHKRLSRKIPRIPSIRRNSLSSHLYSFGFASFVESNDFKKFLEAT